VYSKGLWAEEKRKKRREEESDSAICNSSDQSSEGFNMLEGRVRQRHTVSPEHLSHEPQPQPLHSLSMEKERGQRDKNEGGGREGRKSTSCNDKSSKRKDQRV
jgi:hypothetical protein